MLEASPRSRTREVVNGGETMMTRSLPKVTVVTTGGTIASRYDPHGGAAKPVVSGQELVAGLPGIKQIADLTVHELRLLPSWEFTPAFMQEISRSVAHALAGGADGVVVTQGTDTLEETAYWLDLTLDVLRWQRPVVITGAMRNISEAGADGLRNLLDAILVAAHGIDGCMAPMVVANSQIHAARYVTKTDSYNPATFQSLGQGTVGAVYGSDVSYVRRDITVQPPLQVDDPVACVPLLKWAAGMDDFLLRACQDAAVDGVVIEGFGLGHLPGATVPAIRELRERDIPVVMTTRCQTGPTLAVYGGAGGGQDLLDLGVVFARHLPGPKARLLLIAAIGSGISATELARIFDHAGQ